MGIFWDYGSTADSELEGAFDEALAAEPPEERVRGQKARLLAKSVAGLTPPAALNVGRLVVALLIVAVLLGGGVASEAADLKDSSKALLGLAATAFGLVVGLLGGEKPKS